MFFAISNFPISFRFLIFTIPKSKYQWVRTKISPCVLSTDMYCIVLSCVVYSRLKAFGKKMENETQKN